MTGHCHHDHGHSRGPLGFLSKLRGHSHEFDLNTKENKKRLLVCMLANGTYGALQLLVGFLVLGSMILVTDAFHNLTDMVSLGIPLLAITLSGRHELASLALTWLNYVLLFAFLGGAAYESSLRVFSPESANGTLAMVVTVPAFGAINTGIVMALLAGIGIAVNGYSVLVLQRGQGHDLNMKSAFQHQLVDLIASITAVAASLAIAASGQRVIDPVLTIVVSVALGWMVWPNFMQSMRNLRDGLFGHRKKVHAH